MLRLFSSCHITTTRNAACKHEELAEDKQFAITCKECVDCICQKRHRTAPLRDFRTMTVCRAHMAQNCPHAGLLDNDRPPCSIYRAHSQVRTA